MEKGGCQGQLRNKGDSHSPNRAEPYMWEGRAGTENFEKDLEMEIRRRSRKLRLPRCY